MEFKKYMRMTLVIITHVINLSTGYVILIHFLEFRSTSVPKTCASIMKNIIKPKDAGFHLKICPSEVPLYKA